MHEEINQCPKCRKIESFKYNSFEEVVFYTSCECKKAKKQELINGMKPLDFAFAQIDKMLASKKKGN